MNAHMRLSLERSSHLMQSTLVLCNRCLQCLRLQRSVPPVMERQWRHCEHLSTSAFDSHRKTHNPSERVKNGIPHDANALAILANVPRGSHTASGILRSMADQRFVSPGALFFSK